jgi:DNA-binding NarL/FixJ family response regulator
MATRTAQKLPQDKIRIFLVDDHPLVREGLAETLGREADLVICGQADSRQRALGLFGNAQPDLVIVDLALNDSHGIELIRDIRARFPKMLVLVVSMHDEMLYAERAIRAGAAGYVEKKEAAARIVEAIREVLRGGTYLSARVASHIAARHIGRRPTDRQPAGAVEQLADRELEVLELVGEGLSRQQIAARLGLDVNTVETYRGRLRLKLHLKDAQELLQFAIRHNRQPDL